MQLLRSVSDFSEKLALVHAIKTLLCCISENIFCNRNSEFWGFYFNNNCLEKKTTKNPTKSQEKEFDYREKCSEFQGEKKRRKKEKNERKINKEKRKPVRKML